MRSELVFNEKGVKRILDIAMSLIIMTVFLPLLCIVLLFVNYKMGKPVFFKQKRPGLYGEVFFLCKFRTMTNEKDDDGKLLPDSERLIPFGLFLRKTSLDELPTFFNVLKGDMSLVGPRPLLVQYLDRYTKEQARRHEVRPGITGWAQVNGRNALSWEEKFELDVWYVDNWSLWLDLKILFKTVWITIKRDNTHHDGHVTMSEFRGSDKGHFDDKV